MTTILITPSSIIYKYDGKIHRTDGPAVIYKNGDTQWYLYGRIHREDGPAMTLNSHVTYCINGEYVRNTNTNTNTVIRHGQYVQKIILSDGHAFYHRALLHCEDGPAVEYKTGIKQYWLCGVEYTLDEYLKLVRLDSI